MICVMTIVSILISFQAYGQTVENYKVDLGMSELKFNGTVKLKDIEKIDQSGQPLMNVVSGASSLRKLD